MDYTVAIRTLGTAGEKYQRELDSLMNQSIPPKEIIVYIAEGRPIPKESCGKEKCVYVKKGMVAQRALPYDDVSTEWILFLDDDVYLPPKSVETLFKTIEAYGADVVSPNTFENHRLSKRTKFMNRLLAKALPIKSEYWAYKVINSGGFAYNCQPTKDFYWSETNAGPCFLCRKDDFLKIHFEEELWLDDAPYALPEDQVMFYKMHLSGLRVGTVFNSGIEHLDAGTTVKTSPDRTQKMLYSEYRNQQIFWHRFIKRHCTGWSYICARLALSRYKIIRKMLTFKSLLKGDSTQWQALRWANESVRSYLGKK